MSSKRVKQYLMLLTAIGLIAIASGGGSGTFASFTAEVHNPGNTFATGSLYLHDSVVNGNPETTCTSESATDNTNVPSTVNGSTTGDTCGYIFNVPSSQFAPDALLDGALSGTVTSIPVTDWNGGTTGTIFDIPDATEVEISQGANSDICETDGDTPPGSPSITVHSCVLSNAYTSAYATVSAPGPFIGHLTLRNAGTIDGKDLSFQFVGTGAAPSADPSCPVTPGPSTATTLCSHLKFSIIETDDTFGATIDPATGDITGAVGCAFGSSNGSGCDVGSDTLGSASSTYFRTGVGNSLEPLTLASGTGTCNTRNLTGVDSTLNHSACSGPTPFGNDPGSSTPEDGGARYFLVEVWPGSLANNDMGASTTFDLVWHMDQA